MYEYDVMCIDVVRVEIRTYTYSSNKAVCVGDYISVSSIEWVLRVDRVRGDDTLVCVPMHLRLVA